MCQCASDIDGRDTHIKSCGAAAKNNPVLGTAPTDKEFMVFRTFLQNVPENVPLALPAAAVSVVTGIFLHGHLLSKLAVVDRLHDSIGMDDI